MNYSEIINSAPVLLVEFYASWCPHCQRMMPIVEQIKELLQGQVTIRQFDIDKNRQLAEEAGADTIPLFIIYRNSKEMWRHSGEMEGDVLLAKIQQYI